MRKSVTLLGSTGSIGTQSLEVASHLGVKVNVLACGGGKAELLIEQAKRFEPKIVAVADCESAEKVQKALKTKNVKVLSGEDGVCEAASYKNSDIVISAIVGNAGIKPTFAAIENKLDIALANKETLVSCGELFLKKIAENDVELLPVDSEHSAIFQCLRARDSNKINRIILTASGGPFFGKTKEELKNVDASQALNHPTWRMGGKISIDSATLMNKGLEVVEAKFLFGVPTKDICVVVHPQSVLHSAVEFDDGAIIAQMGTPDMRLPIQYALTFPERFPSLSEKLELSKIGSLTFAEPDFETFPCLKAAYSALSKGGTTMCAMNSANEVSVKAFMEGKIAFCDIAYIVEKVVEEHIPIIDYNYEEIIDADSAGKAAALEVVDEIIKKEGKAE